MPDVLTRSEPQAELGPAKIQFFAHVSLPCRNPSGNVIELCCADCFTGTDQRPRGTSAAHDLAVGIGELVYTELKRPSIKRSRDVVRD